MADEAEKHPLPQEGGCYTRLADGSLVKQPDETPPAESESAPASKSKKKDS